MWQKVRGIESEGADRNVGISQYFLSVVFLEHHRSCKAAWIDPTQVGAGTARISAGTGQMKAKRCENGLRTKKRRKSW